jgi:hypothetical protein
MSFRPGKVTDLVRPEPQSTTGRAIASLSLRRLNEDFSALRDDTIRDAATRAAFVEFRRSMDALLPGRPKARVAVLAMPFVRAPLERSLYASDDALLEAAEAGRLALRDGPELDRALARRGAQVWREGPLTFSADVAPAFGLVGRAPRGEARSELRAALRLLDAAAPTEMSELARFFPLVVPIERGVERRPGVLGLALDEGALGIALRVVETLALEKLERYARLVDRDAGPWMRATRHVARRALLRRLALVRHPIAKAPDALGRLADEDDALSGLEIQADSDESLRGLVDELTRLAQ